MAAMAVRRRRQRGGRRPDCEPRFVGFDAGFDAAFDDNGFDDGGFDDAASKRGRARSLLFVVGRFEADDVDPDDRGVQGAVPAALAAERVHLVFDDAALSGF